MPACTIQKVTPFVANGRPKICWGCGKPFVIRNGHAEAVLGLDDRLYCFDNGCDGDAFVPQYNTLKRAS